MLRRKKKKSGGSASVEAELPAIDFKPKAEDKQAEQGVLIACRGLEQFPAAVILLAQAVDTRADQVLMDFSQQGAAVRFRVDGMWEAMPPMDRATGDGTLAIYKRLAGLNPQDRRNRQKGSFGIKYKGVDWISKVASQGIPTGERVLLRLETKKPVLNTLADLGMREKMQTQLKALLNSEDAMFLFSGAPGHALPTTWRIGLESADRFVRDFHSIQDVSADEPELINITQHTYDSSAGETPMTVLKSLLLKQPDALVFPELKDPEVVGLMCGEVSEEHRYMITKVQAASAVEGLFKLLGTHKKQAKELLKICCGVLNQRLVRRLCPDCRVPFQPSPQLLQKLGIPAGRVKQLYQPFIPPPPEQRVDENGKPIEIEICAKCNGRGYYGRAALFELLVIDDEIRKAVLSKPDPAHVTAVAKQRGFLTFQEEGVLAVATGMTSLQELQRVLSNKK
ncbi:MAG TPA: general secretion pathway protein GspE [Planctomycetaceae bacterium]|nr:general secretion pathway protein GspE [Planctomycetaceae bacterium]